MKKFFSLLLTLTFAFGIFAMAVNAESLCNTWGSSIGKVFYDANGSTTKAIALRFVVIGEGKLTGISPYIGCDNNASSFDIKIYAWDSNYTETVSTEPVADLGTHTFGEGSWTTWRMLDIPNGGLSKGEYLIVMDNYQNITWVVRNYYFGTNAGFKVYADGIAQENKSIWWLLRFDDAWYDSAAALTDTEKQQGSGQEGQQEQEEQVDTTPCNTWGDDNKNEFFDGNENTANKEVALRFVVKGTGRLAGFAPNLAGGIEGEDANATCDIKIYKWQYNYDYTVSQEPVFSKDDLTGVGDNSYNWWTKSVMFTGSQITAGEYLIVMNDFSNAAWAVRNFYYGANDGFKVYENGVAKDGYTIGWQLKFTADTWYDDSVVFTDTKAPVPTTADYLPSALALTVAAVTTAIVLKKKHSK